MRNSRLKKQESPGDAYEKATPAHVYIDAFTNLPAAHTYQRLEKSEKDQRMQEARLFMKMYFAGRDPP